MRTFIALSLACIFSFSQNAAAASSGEGTAIEPITLATGEWAPYTSETFLPVYGSFGIAADILTAALAHAKYTPRFTFNRFGASYNLVRDSTASSAPIAGFPYYKTAARSKDVLFSQPILTVADVIFYNRRKTPELGGIKDLNQLEKYKNDSRFVASYCYQDELQAVLDYQCKTAEVDTTQARRQTDVEREFKYEIDAFKALIEDEDVRLLPATKSVGLRILQTSFADRQSDIKIIPAFEWHRNVHVIAPKSEAGEKFIEHLNQGLRAVKNSPSYERLRNRAYPVLLASRLVRLNDPGDFPLVVGQEPSHGDQPPAIDGADVIIPRGTNALVVKWSGSFLTTETGAVDLPAELQRKSLVQIVNGPLVGRRLWVKNMYIEVPDAALTLSHDGLIQGQISPQPSMPTAE
jgi:hypothetical protein